MSKNIAGEFYIASAALQRLSTRPGKRVAMVAFGPGRQFTPHWDGRYEIWGVNNLHVAMNDLSYRFDRWFQLHDPAWLNKYWSHEWPEHEEWLMERHGFPIFMFKKHRKYPDSVKYPKKAVEALAGFGNYHTISFSWMVGLAILEGFSTIELYGISAGPGEPAAGRACLEYWLGLAEGRGITVYVQGPSDLFHSVHTARLYSDLQYGYEPEPVLPTGWKDMR